MELEVGERTVRLTNPDRVYFPARGQTKLDLARYYMAVGDGIVRALLIDASATGLRAGVCAACQNRKGDQQGTRSYPRRRSAVSIATSTREVMPGTSTGRRPAT